MIAVNISLVPTFAFNVVVVQAPIVLRGKRRSGFLLRKDGLDLRQASFLQTKGDYCAQLFV